MSPSGDDIEACRIEENKIEWKLMEKSCKVGDVFILNLFIDLFVKRHFNRSSDEDLNSSLVGHH